LVSIVGTHLLRATGEFTYDTIAHQRQRVGVDVSMARQ
jgi:hypothetical protein